MGFIAASASTRELSSRGGDLLFLDLKNRRKARYT
jgi:hypothetical protein